MRALNGMVAVIREIQLSGEGMRPTQGRTDINGNWIEHLLKGEDR